MWDHLAVNGHLVSITPLPGDWHWHGIWYPTEEFYDALAYRNDMAVIEFGEYGAPPCRCLFLVARKLQERAFVYPGEASLSQRDSKPRLTSRKNSSILFHGERPAV